MSENIEQQAFSLRHAAMRNSQYHIARRRFMDDWNRFFNFAIVLSGTGTVFQATTTHPQYAAYIAGMITVIGALQLVFDFSGRARLHEILQRRYVQLLADMEKITTHTNEQCAIWTGTLTEISADEPPALRAMDAIADNQATNALIGGNKPRIIITNWQSFTRNFLAHNTGEFPIDPEYKQG